MMWKNLAPRTLKASLALHSKQCECISRNLIFNISKSVLSPRNPDVSKRWLPWQLLEATSDGRSGTLRTRDVVRVCSLFGDNAKTEPVAFARRFSRTKNEQIPCAVHDCHRFLGCSVCQGGKLAFSFARMNNVK
ncbi:hypothetical protein CDAR_574061 [Caerostris darwini]|uniref:Uncharacterized protein n=1 Tax=Caerostris darwini TaxID=1538125 RepID=A0AAV4T8I7_9ARAC|nr:hypothetical protein CDAR_574061 [Caerostris darwini]